MNYSNKQNQEIAFDLGFNDAAHFSRLFKKMAQLTRTECREWLVEDGEGEAEDRKELSMIIRAKYINAPEL